MNYFIYDITKLGLKNFHPFKFIFYKANVLVEANKDFNTISRFTRGYEVVSGDIVDSPRDALALFLCSNILKVVPYNKCSNTEIQNISNEE